MEPAMILSHSMHRDFNNHDLAVKLQLRFSHFEKEKRPTGEQRRPYLFVRFLSRVIQGATIGAKLATQILLSSVQIYLPSTDADKLIWWGDAYIHVRTNTQPTEYKNPCPQMLACMGVCVHERMNVMYVCVKSGAVDNLLKLGLSMQSLCLL